MDYIVNAAQMRRADQRAICDTGIPAEVLMERAAMALAAETEQLLRKGGKQNLSDCSILVFCGSGNNGGDGFAAARIFREHGIRTIAVLVGSRDHMTPQCRLESEIWERLGGVTFSWEEWSSETASCSRHFDAVVDALFGTGLSRAVAGDYAAAVRWINESGLPVAAADIPSGINADTGAVEGCAVKADLTVTFAARKYGHIFFPGAEYSGKVLVYPVGIDVSGEDAAVWPDDQMISALLPARKPFSNKGTYGKPLLVAGKKGMAGAAMLSAEAAYRSGAGLVTVFSDDENRIPIQTRLPEAIFRPWSDKDALCSSLRSCSSAVIGPGLGTGPDSLALLETVFKNYSGTLIVDADALNLISGHGFPVFEGTIIATPHPGEMARLLRCSIPEVSAAPLECARRFASEHGLICVLKDAFTIITDGDRVWIEHPGTSGMATGGSGDVLAGLIGGLCALGLSPFEAAAAGVWLHGKAGSSAARALGDDGMLAGDILRFLPETIRRLRSE